MERSEDVKKSGICFICPLYPPDFTFGQYLAYQFIQSPMDLCFVFTTANEYQDFVRLVCKGADQWFSVKILEDIVSANIIKNARKNRTFPTLKKFVALDALWRNYDWLICIDAETILLEKDGWVERCRELFARKKWYGGSILPHMQLERKIIESGCTELVPENDVIKLKSLTYNYTFFSWWWDIPAYSAAHVEGFLHWINWGDVAANKLSWFSFDYLIYQCYTVLKCGFQFAKIDSIIHSLEFSGAQTYRYVARKFEPPTWVNSKAYLEDVQFSNTQKFLAVYHLDRVDFPDFSNVIVPLSGCNKNVFFKEMSKKIRALLN